MKSKKTMMLDLMMMLPMMMMMVVMRVVSKGANLNRTRVILTQDFHHKDEDNGHLAVVVELGIYCLLATQRELWSLFREKIVLYMLQYLQLFFYLRLLGGGISLFQTRKFMIF